MKKLRRRKNKINSNLVQIASNGKDRRKAFKTKSPKYTSQKSHTSQDSNSRLKFLESFYAEPIVASIISVSTGRYIDVNTCFEEFFGLSRKEVIGKTPLELDIWVKKSHRKKAVKDFLQEGSFGKFSLRVIAAGGKIKDVFAVTEIINFNGEDCYLGRLYDITGQIESSRKIKEGEEKFSNLVENSLDVIFEFDIRHQSYRYISPSSKEILGIQPEVFLKKKSGVIFSILLNEDRSKLTEHYKKISASRGPGKRSFYIEYRIKYDKDDIRWLGDNRTVLYNNKGKPESMIGNITDITFRKSAQEELLRSYELQKGYLNLLGSIQDALPAYIAMLDKKGDIVNVNRSWLNFDEGNSLIGKNHTVGENYISICKNVNCICAKEALAAAAGIKKVLKGTLKEFQIEYPCHSAGKQRWFNLLVSPIGKTTPSGAVVMHVDSTKQKQAELALKASEEQFRRLFEEDLTGNYISDIHGSIQLCNKSFADMIGFSNSAGVINSPLFNIFNKDFGNVHFINLLKKHEKIPIHERVIKRSDGKELIVIENVIGNYDAGGKLINVHGYMLDITARKKAEEELVKKSREITVLYEAQRELTKTLDLNSVYDNSYRIVSGLVPCDTMLVSSYDKKENMIKILSVWTEGYKPALEEIPSIPLAPEGYGIQSNVIHTGQSLLILDYKSYFKKSINKYTFNDDKLDKNIKSIYSSAMIVPMKIESSVIGTIQVLSFKKDAYTENDLRMLETLTTHITAATANAQLYQQAQNEIMERAKAEAQLRQRTDEITLLYEAYKDLTSTLDTKVIYGKVYDVIRKVMPCDAMSIISMEKISGDMKFVSLWQDDVCHDTTMMPMMKYNPENKGLITELIRTGEPKIYNNYYDEVQKSPGVFAVDDKGEISKELNEVAGDPVTRSAILVPMKIENSIIGVITVYSYEKEAYREENLKILEALTTELSAATLNAMLYQQAQKEIEERIRNEAELTSIRTNLEEAQRIAHIGSWFYDIETNLMTNSDEVFKILGIEPTQEGFEFEKAMNFVHEEDRKQTMKNINDAIFNKKSYVNEDRIIRPDGEIRYVKLMGEPAFDDKGNYKGIHGTMQDITEIKLINAELIRSLSEKEMMLKEIHHRVKNNLQIVSSLLRLQSDKITDRTAIDYLKQSEQRVKSMALIHQQLYRTKDLSKIDFREYLKELCSYLIFAYGVSSQKISLQIESDEIYFGIDTALPCGLIVNELLTNSIKHAFPGNRTGNITIKLYKDDSNINHLTVKDDGIGGKLDFKNADTLGLELVSTLTEQLDGEITSDYNEGTEITISFADQKNKTTN